MVNAKMTSFAGIQQQKKHVGHHEAAPDRQPPQRRSQLGRGEGDNFTNILQAAFFRTKVVQTFFFVYNVFHKFRQAKIADGGSILGSNQFFPNAPAASKKQSLRQKWSSSRYLRSKSEKLTVQTFFFFYNVFHKFWQAKFTYDGSILSSSYFLQLP